MIPLVVDYLLNSLNRRPKQEEFVVVKEIIALFTLILKLFNVVHETLSFYIKLVFVNCLIF